MIHTSRRFKRGRGRPVDDPLALAADQEIRTEPAVDAYTLAATYALQFKAKNYAEAYRNLEKLRRLMQRSPKYDDETM